MPVKVAWVLAPQAPVTHMHRARAYAAKKDWKPALVDLDEAIKQVFPGARLEIEHDERTGLFAVMLHVPGLCRPLRSRELSDGTIRYLCLLAALLSPRPPALLALNEPETSLHPDLLEPLARQLVKAGKYSQLWIVTHSSRLAELVEKFSGEAPITLELVGGETRVKGQHLIEDSEEEAG